MSILIRDVQLEGKRTSIHIEGSRIASVGDAVEADTVIEGAGKAVIPGMGMQTTSCSTNGSMSISGPSKASSPKRMSTGGHVSPALR